MLVQQGSNIFKRSLLELQFEQQLIDAGITDYVIEYKFMRDRKFRADFCIKKLKLIIEVEGGLWNGRHTTATGYTADCRKYNEAAILGYTVIRVTAEMINSEDLEALDFVKRAIESRKRK